MKYAQKDYTLETLDDGSGAVLSGVLRLASPAAYEQAFAPLRQQISARTGQPYTLDLAALTFMNSSGITGLSRLVLLARAGKMPLTVMVSDTVPWQRKTIAALQKLHPQLSIVAKT